MCFLFCPPKKLGKNWTLHSHPPRCRKRRAAVWCTAGKAPAAPFGSPRWFSLRRGQTPMILLILLGDVGFFQKKKRIKNGGMLWIWWGVGCVGFLWEIPAPRIRKNQKKTDLSSIPPTVLEIKAMGNNSPVKGALHMGCFVRRWPQHGSVLVEVCPRFVGLFLPRTLTPRNLINDPSWRAVFFPSDSLTSTLNLCCGGQFPWCFTLDFFDSSLVEIGAFQHISLPFNVIIMRSILYHRIDLWNRGLCEFVNRFWYHFSKKSGSLELVEEKVWATMILHNGGRVQTLLTCMV